MIRIYTISRVLAMGDTMGCGVVSIRVNRHFSRHGKLGPQEGRELGLVYTIRKAPADNGTLRRGTTSDERKGRPCWRFHCPAWWSNSQENMQINYLQRLTRKLRLGGNSPEEGNGLPPIDVVLCFRRTTTSLGSSERPITPDKYWEMWNGRFTLSRIF